MPKAFRPELMWNYSPVIRPQPPLVLDDVCGDESVCVSFSCEFIPYILGLLEIYRWPDRFSGTPEQQEHSAGLFRDLMEEFAMACCCNDTSSITQIVLHQINSITLQLEISVDGGTTWTPDPESPITQINQQPAPVTSGHMANKCDAATNGKQHVEDLIQSCHDYLSTAVTVFDLAVGVMTALLALAVAYFSGLTLAGAAAALAQTIWQAAHAAFDYGVGAFDANWTLEERDKILCSLYCHIGDDGTFSETQYAEFLADWKSHAAVNPAFYLVFDTVKAGGRVSLNNMCSYGNVAEADCASCGCEVCGDDWVVGTRFNAPGDPVGIMDSFGVDEVTGRWYVVMSSQDDGTGDQAIFITSGDSNNCCNINATDFQLVSGTAWTTTSFCECGHVLTDWGFGWIGTKNVNSMGLANEGSAFTVKIFFNSTS
jgi:hypothetical protein